MKLLLKFIFVAGVLLFTPLAFANGPIFVNADAELAHWLSGSSISLDMESGDCAGYDNDTMKTRLENAADAWASVTNVDLAFDVTQGNLDDSDVDTDGDDIDLSNYSQFYVSRNSITNAQDTLNAVIFDDTGDITDELYSNDLGADAKYMVLGFAAPTFFETADNTISDGQVFLNCLCYDGNEQCVNSENEAVDFLDEDLDFTLTHELGHFLGLTHSVVNAELEDDCDADVDGDCDDLPTMYPISVDPADQVTLTRDDEVGILKLYGSDGWDNTLCAAEGNLVDLRGLPLRCVDVQAIATDDSETIEAVSGADVAQEDLGTDNYTDDDGECLGDCGYFKIWGLNPAKTYDIVVKPINTFFTGAKTVLPCGSYQLEGVQEETLVEGFQCNAAGQTDSIDQAGVTETISCSGLIEDMDFDGDGQDDCTTRGGVPLLDADGNPTDINTDPETGDITPNDEPDCCISACGGTGACEPTSDESDGGGDSGGLAQSGCQLRTHAPDSLVSLMFVMVMIGVPVGLRRFYANKNH
ncbi:hypothetical protein K1X76_08850 [bacterium]|nr:hypothetical protein [bacterium]